MSLSSAAFETSAALKTQFPQPTLPEIVFVGRSNVGKSSLLNTMLEKKNLAKVSNTPGKTKLINFFRVPNTVRFVDLPGYGYAKVSVREREEWKRLIDSYFFAPRPIALVLVLIDVRLPLQYLDQQMIGWLLKKNLPVQIVLTKIDKLKKNELAKQKKLLLASIRESGLQDEPILFSSETGDGGAELRNRILEVIAKP